MTTIQLKNVVTDRVIYDMNLCLDSSKKIVNIHGLILDEIPKPIKLNSKIFRSGIYLCAKPKYKNN